MGRTDGLPPRTWRCAGERSYEHPSAPRRRGRPGSRSAPPSTPHPCGSPPRVALWVRAHGDLVRIASDGVARRAALGGPTDPHDRALVSHTHLERLVRLLVGLARMDRV